MRIATPKESAQDERRVALTPDGVKELCALGAHVSVQAGAGEGSYFSDDSYRAVGASIIDSARELCESSDVVLRVNAPSLAEIGELKDGSVHVSFLWPDQNHELIQAFERKKVLAFAMDRIPRITRAQSMDALSSMSTIAGYRAAISAANHLPRFFPMLMTAAGTIPPARVLVLGAGVAGLQAIATCRRLGAIVEAFDVRSEVKEQIESLGAKFVGLSGLDAQGGGGYAKELSHDQQGQLLELIAKRLPNLDVVIGTALIPGRPAPRLITKEMLSCMKPGSVIVDLAAANGGNCEVTVAGTTVIVDGITLVGRTDFVTGMPTDASKMYSKNITAFVTPMIKDGTLSIDFEDEIVRGTLVTTLAGVVA